MHGRDPLRVALLGCGVVGTEVARLLTTHADDLAARVGRPLRAGRASPCAGRGGPAATSASTRRCSPTDAEGLVARADVDVVVEVIGGIEPARVADPRRDGARRLGRHRQQGAARRGRRRRCTRPPTSTASTSTTRPPSAGAIPLLRPLRESLAGDRVRRVLGIVNGTTNYVLDPMDRDAAPASPRRSSEAQALGYAEADPTADVEGFDAAAKAAILASLAFHTRVDRRRRPPRGHHRGHRRRRRQRAARWAASSSCSRSASVVRGRHERRRCACTRR